LPLKLLSFQPYGCGVVLGFPVPPNLCGGKLMLRVQLTSESGQFEGILSVFCIIGPNPPIDSHDDESGEGARLDIIGVNNFNKNCQRAETFISRRISSTSGKHPLASCTFRHLDTPATMDWCRG